MLELLVVLWQTGFITSSGLDPNKLRGQAYDGAGNMADKTKGAAAIITSQFPLPPLCISLAQFGVYGT